MDREAEVGRQDWIETKGRKFDVVGKEGTNMSWNGPGTLSLESVSLLELWIVWRVLTLVLSCYRLPVLESRTCLTCQL